MKCPSSKLLLRQQNLQRTAYSDSGNNAADAACSAHKLDRMPEANCGRLLMFLSCPRAEAAEARACKWSNSCES